jgi:acetaldehyde dehydrogenase/alcohol dehydrogenase
LTLKEYGVDEAAYLAAIPKMAERAFEDQCTTANPRYPLVSELEEIYRKTYYGE